MATMTELSLADAQHETNEARAASVELNARVDVGDPDVQVGELAVARERVDLAERRLRAVERREHERAEAARVERRDAARRDLLELHAQGRADVGNKVEAAQVALDDLLSACKTHDAQTLAAARRLRDLTSLDSESASDVIYSAASDEFVANVAGTKIYVTQDAFMLAQLAAEALERAGVRDRSPAQAGLAQVASAWPRDALYPWRDR
jgi:hypothetical protein